MTAFFRPDLSLVGYAFLGAYVFTLFHVIRGYQRRDLHPKSYNTVVVRILGAYVMALVVSVVWDGPGAEVMMFFVGFMPQSALVWLREKLSQRHGLWGAVPLEELAPLTELEGIDLYDRTRLAEEGVNNVEALAHADIVDLMSSTRIAAAELVDWADQAILYLRVGGDAAARVKARRASQRRRRRPVRGPNRRTSRQQPAATSAGTASARRPTCCRRTTRRSVAAAAIMARSRPRSRPCARALELPSKPRERSDQPDPDDHRHPPGRGVVHADPQLAQPRVRCGRLVVLVPRRRRDVAAAGTAPRAGRAVQASVRRILDGREQGTR